MKGILLKGICLLSLSALTVPSLAQNDRDELRLAVDVLKGMDSSQSQEWAVQTLETSLQTDSVPYVMNVLGVAYLHGVGVPADTVKAVSLLEEAGKGYPLAYHNLGMHYKYAEGNRQDFQKAYETFLKGTESKSPTCCYDAAFMLYKGLGCEQDYSEAVNLFQVAADANHQHALFMLGLCYRNGYGVEKDTERAMFYLERAAELNCTDAMEELAKDRAETEIDRESLPTKHMHFPENMPSTSPFIPGSASAVAGRYEGALVTYDWSGSTVVSELPLTIDMHEHNDSLAGMWIQGNDSIRFSAVISGDNELKFVNTAASLYDRYSDDYKALYRFDNAAVSCDNNGMQGSLRLYSYEEMEPDRPMFISVSKCAELKGDNANSQGKVFAYQRPFSGDIIIKFILDEYIHGTKVDVTTQTGFKVSSYHIGNLCAGEHTYTISPELSGGVYVLQVKASKFAYSTVIVKNN